MKMAHGSHLRAPLTELNSDDCVVVSTTRHVLPGMAAETK